MSPPDHCEHWQVWCGDEDKDEFEEFCFKLSAKSQKAYLDWVKETALACGKPLRAIPSYVLNISEEFIKAYNSIVLTAAPTIYTFEEFTLKTLQVQYPALAHSVLVGEETFFDAARTAVHQKKNKQRKQEEIDEERGGRGGRGGSKITAAGSGGGSGGGRAKDAADGKKRKRLKQPADGSGHETEEEDEQIDEDNIFKRHKREKRDEKQKLDDEDEAVHVVDVSLHSKLSQALIAQNNFQTLHMIQAAIRGLADVQAQTNALKVLVSAVIALLVSQADFNPEIQQACFQSLLETFNNSELAKHEHAKGAPTPALKVQAILSTLAEQVGLKQEMTKALKSWVV